MAPEKTKPGVVSALSRILHLHQLPDHAPDIAKEKTPLVLNRELPLSPPARAEPAAPIPPAYAGKPFIIPEARKNNFVPIPPVSAASNPPNGKPINTGLSYSSLPTEAGERKTIFPSVPASMPVAPHESGPKPRTMSPTGTASPNPWPFPAPWIKSQTPTPTGKTAPVTAKTTVPLTANKSVTLPEKKTISAPTPPIAPAAPRATPVVLNSGGNASPPKSPPVAAAPAVFPAPMRTAASLTPGAYPNGESIVTNFDRILDIVRLQKNIKLDELTKRMGMAEEKVAEELQTLEDNGLIEVRYPAFGEPIIYYKG